MIEVYYLTYKYNIMQYAKTHNIYNNTKIMVFTNI